MAELAITDKPAEAIRLALEATALLDAGTPILRERVTIAQARLVQGRAVAAAGDLQAGRALMNTALAALAAQQDAGSPRVAGARTALAALAQ